MAQFKLAERGADGETLEHTLRAAARLGSAGARAELAELEAHALPAEMGAVWQWFGDLAATSGKVGTAATILRAPIAEADIRAYFLNRRLRPEPWQVDTIVRLDRIARSDLSKWGSDE